MFNERIDRRAACRRFAAVSAAAMLGTQARAIAAAAPFQLHYALASSLYGTLPLADVVAETPRIGASVIDLWPRPHADQREQMDALGEEAFVELLRRHGVTLGMTTRYDLGPQKLADELRLVKRFGGRLVVTGSVGPKNVEGAEARKAVTEFVEQMKPHVALAEELGVTIGIENHANALIATPDSLRYLAELSPSPRLGIALAPYHLPQDAAVLARLIEDLGPRLVHFYAWQHGHGSMTKLPKEEELLQMPGRGPLDFAPVMAALAKIGYAGWTQIFMHPFPRGIPILPTASEVTAEVNCAREYLAQCIAASEPR